MVRDILRLDLAFGLKTFEPSRENPYLCGREQCQPEGFTVHVMICVDFFFCVV